MTASPPTTPHWHAFRFVGKGWTDSERGRGMAPNNFPRDAISRWIKEMPTVGLYFEDQIDKAVDWLEGELIAQPPQDAEHYPVKERLEASRARLNETRQRDVVYGYWSVKKNYCSLGLIYCEGGCGR